MTTAPTPAQAASAALAQLLARHPELDRLVWTVGETPGVLKGFQVTETGTGEIIDLCAQVMGGTVARSVLDRSGDRQGIAQLVTGYDGVPVEVWASYLLPGADGLTSTELYDLLVGRPLGTVAVLPGGGG
ncbi:hypothetical protein ACIQMV_19520 [Streptomyces sp. NPDC091412]|uniref:hypothetical protein n=1 Tax=Streptomyces sp. NPDC091412 TaxID=3366002 RepID=UPI00381EC947